VDNSKTTSKKSCQEDIVIQQLKPKSEFGQNILTLMTGTTIAQAIPLAISPILARIYTPEDFGVYALFVAIVGLMSVMAAFRYEQAILLPKFDKNAINVFMLGVGLVFMVFFASELFIFIFYKEIVSIINNEQIGIWLYFAPVTAMFIAIFNLLVSYSNRTKNYHNIAQATVIKSLVLATGQIAIGFLRIGPTGLIFGQVIAQFFANIKLFKNIVQDKKLISSVSRLKMYSLAKRYRNFPKYNTPHALLGAISESMPVYILTLYFSSELVGYYAFSLMVVLAPLMILSVSISKVYNQKIVEIKSSGDAYLFSFNLIVNLMKKVLLPYVLFVLYAPEVFVFVFGSNWQESSVIVQILSPWLLLVFIVGTLSYLPSIYNQQKKAMRIEIMNFIIKLIALMIGVYYQNFYLLLFLYSFFSCLVLIYTLHWYSKILRGAAN
jgi:O-antigen/teichoic acid export membrane protein